MIRVIIYNSRQEIVYTMRKGYNSHGFRDCIYFNGKSIDGGADLIPIKTVAKMINLFKLHGFNVKIERIKEYSPFEIATFYINKSEMVEP